MKILYTLIVAAWFWVRELGGAGSGTVAEAETVAEAGAGAGTGAGIGAGAAWCCLKCVFLSWACWKTEAIKKKKNNQISITHYSQNW